MISSLRNEMNGPSCFRRRKDWSSITNATEEPNNISTEKCPLELEENMLVTPKK